MPDFFMHFFNWGFHSVQVCSTPATLLRSSASSRTAKSYISAPINSFCVIMILYEFKIYFSEDTIMSLTKDQQLAKQAVESGKNVFISGAAGVGKSYILNQIIADSPENTVVCAPTGIAALNVNGVTIHRLLSLTPSSNIIGEDPTGVPEKLEKAKRVIVDEISMCRSDLFIWLSKCLKLAEKKSKRKSHIQLIVCGDFCQLPPVVANEKEKEYFADGKQYAFNTDEWRDWKFENVVLSEIVRQSNKKFSSALNKIRISDDTGIKYISSHSAKKRIKSAISVVTRNDDAEEINYERLRELKGKTHVYECKKIGRVTKQDEPVPEELKLRKKARIVFATNDSQNRFKNGTSGTVVDFDDEDPTNPLIKVKVDDGDKSGFWLPQSKWSIYDYKFVQIQKITKTGKKRKVKVLKKVEIGEYWQFPFKLGYAVTVHKSQGQTYDAANIHPAGWASGLLYVALSRVKDVKNMYLEQPLEPDMVYTDDAVINFYKKINDHRGGARKGAGRKQKYAVKSTAMRVPDILASVLKQTKTLSKADLTELSNMIDEFVQNHK